jgi:hypothetical protein
MNVEKSSLNGTKNESNKLLWGVSFISVAGVVLASVALAKAYESSSRQSSCDVSGYYKCLEGRLSLYTDYIYVYLTLFIDV